MRGSVFPSNCWHCVQVEVLEDQSTGKRTIRTTSMCWGNKLSLLARPALFDPRLQADPRRPDLDFSQPVLEISDDEAWQKVRPHACSWRWRSLSLADRQAERLPACDRTTDLRCTAAGLPDLEEQDRQLAYPAVNSRWLQHCCRGSNVVATTLSCQATGAIRARSLTQRPLPEASCSGLAALALTALPVTARGPCS